MLNIFGGSGKKGKKITQVKQLFTETGKPVITNTGKIVFITLGA